MPIFRRDTTATPQPPSATAAGGGESPSGARRGTVTFVAPGTRIKGEVTGATEIHIEGELEGDVKVEALVVVGAGGSVRGPISGRVVRVAGQVAGDVTGAERVEVSAAGSVEGDIAAPRVVIAEGAFFKGKIDMQSDNQREPRRPAKAGAESPKTAAAEQARNAGAAEAGSK